jgi:hypothetical protein
MQRFASICIYMYKHGKLMVMKQTLKLMAVFLVLIGSFAACTKEDKDGFYTLIEAKVENASKYSNIVEVKLMYENLDGYIELARGNWKDGDFTIKFPKTLNPDYLQPLVDKNRLQPTIVDTPSTLIISNKSVKVWNAQFWGVDEKGSIVTRLFPFEIDKDGNAHLVFYTYTNSEASISGYTEREGIVIDTEFHNEAFKGMDVHPIWFNKITATYSLEWKEGWNLWIFSRFRHIPEEHTVTEWWSSDAVSKLRWYGGEDLRGINF